MTSGFDIIAKLKADERGIQSQLEKMRKPVLELEAVLKNIQGTIAFYEDKAHTQAMTEVMTDVVSSALGLPKLKGLSHSEAVIAIAKHNGGVVRTQDAKRLMIKAGIMSQTKNSTNMAHNAINRIDKFERIAPGEYRLKTESQSETKAVPERELLPLRPPVN